MMKKSATLFSFAVFVSVLLSGCSGVSIVQTNKSLTVYFGNYIKDNPKAMNFLTTDYKSENEQVKFELYDPTGGDTTMSKENALKKMDADIMVGKGPDLIVDDASSMDIYKMVKADAFYDVNPFMNSDSGFKIGKYNRAVMDSGVIGGKRCIVPLNYSIPLLLTTKEKMQKDGFRPDACTGADRFNSEAIRVLGQDSSCSLYNQECYGKMWSFQFPEVFDFEKEQASFDTPQFKRAMELCKKEYAREKRYPKLSAEWHPSPQYTEFLERFAKDNILFDQTLNAGGQFDDGPFFQTFGQPELLSVYNDAGGLTAQVQCFAAITANSHNRQNAYNFLKLLLSPGLQSYLVYPVLNSEISMLSQLCKTVTNQEIDSSKSEREEGHPIAKLPDSFYQTSDGFPAKINRVILHMSPYNELLNQFQPYFDGKESYDKCLKDAQNYFDIYLSE